MFVRTSKVAAMDAQINYDQVVRDKSVKASHINYFKYHKPYSCEYLSKELIDSEGENE